MDFDSVITFVLFLLFFILPSILKQVKARKKKSLQTQKVKNPSFFAKIGQQVRQFVQELEQQAQQQQTADTNENIKFNIEPESAPGTEIEIEPLIQAAELKPEPESLESDNEKQFQSGIPSIQMSDQSQPAISMNFKKNVLQNAIVWSEILSRPVALRDK